MGIVPSGISYACQIGKHCGMSGNRCSCGGGGGWTGVAMAGKKHHKLNIRPDPGRRWPRPLAQGLLQCMGEGALL